jgi:hypothetical protein
VGICVEVTEAETAKVQTNVMWVVAQVLGHADPNLDPYEFGGARKRDAVS